MTKRRRRSDAGWQQLIEQQQGSGLSVSAFCQQQGLSSKTFYKRRRALHEATDTTARFIKIQPPSTPPVGEAITAVLHYHDSQLHLPAGVDARWLAQLMQALS